MKAASSASLPPLFGRTRHLLGWQGFTATVPADWNPGKVAGNRLQGDLRVDDENGVRLEIRWEKSKHKPDIAKSIVNFQKQLEKDAKKRGENFQIVDEAKVVSRGKKRKEQVTSFGWIGAADSSTSCGFGAAWFCPVCERTTFAHVVGQRGERAEKIERLASEVLTSLECHGEGGWETWSVFDLQIEIPVEFELAGSQLLLNKIEMQWVRPRPVGFYGWGRRAERLKISRFPVANVLLDGKTLEDWADWNVRAKHKLLALGLGEETEVKEHPAVKYHGVIKDLKQRAGVWLFDKVLRRRTPPAEILVWSCPQSNRLWVWEHEVSGVNAHVPTDVLDSLACH